MFLYVHAFCVIILICAWKWDLCVLCSLLGDNKLWVCIKNGSFNDFCLLGLQKENKTQTFPEADVIPLAPLNWDFQFFFSGKQKLILSNFTFIIVMY